MSFRPTLRRTAALAFAAAAVAPAPAAAQLQSGQGTTAPAYPGNTIEVERPKPLVAGTVERVRLSGHAEWGEPTSALTTDYSLSLYVADPRLDPTCATWSGEQRQRAINVPGLNASASPTGFVLDGGLSVKPTVPAPGVDWSGDSVPFVVRRGLTSVMLCAYQRYVTDDVASYALRVPVQEPRCTLRAKAVRRGKRVALRCNVDGRVAVRFTRGGRSRTVRATLTEKRRTVSSPRAD